MSRGGVVQKTVPLVQETKKKISGRGYINELKEEMKKVTWTSKEELTTCTKIVVGSTFMFGLGIYFVDLVIRGTLNSFNIIVHKIFG